MISETRRRAYLDAMQVASWLPRTELPFAAPSRLHLLEPLAPAEPVALPAPAPAVVSASVAEPAGAAQAATAARPRVRLPEPAKAEPVAEEPSVAAAPVQPSEPPPRFALQLLRSGSVLLLVELPTGEPFQSRDPAYILLKDILRAARLPDSPQQVGDGEPIRWPLLHKGSLDQGAEAARDYVQGVLMVELEQMGCDCIWLVGRPALRYAGEADEQALCRELAIEGIGQALALPGLEQLMEDPASKAQLWRALRRSMSRWSIGAESSR